MRATTSALFSIQVAGEAHLSFAETISEMLAESARLRKTGIARRPTEYIATKMREGKAVIALSPNDELAGFCYIETWTHGRYVANSGLIVSPAYRGLNLGKRLKLAAFKLSREKYPRAKIFSITTSPAVMSMNTDLGYRPVPFSDLTTDKEFWDGCASCVNYDILTRNNRENCLCTGLLFDPDRKTRPLEADEHLLPLEWAKSAPAAGQVPAGEG